MSRIAAWLLPVALALLSSGQAAHAQSGEPDEGASFAVEFDLAEVRIDKGDESWLVESSWSYGNDRDQLLLKLDAGGQVGNRLDQIVGQLLYTRAISPSATVVAGVRHDFQPHPHPSFAVLGAEIQATDSLALETNLFLSTAGRLSGEAKAIYGLAITPSLVLEPRIQLNWSAQDYARDAVAAGPTDTEASVRLRYSPSGTVGIYTGVAHERLLGGTADIARAAGDATRATSLVVGISLSL